MVGLRHAGWRSQAKCRQQAQLVRFPLTPTSDFFPAITAIALPPRLKALVRATSAIMRQPGPPAFAGLEVVRHLVLAPKPKTEAVMAARHVNRVAHMIVRERTAFRNGGGQKLEALEVTHTGPIHWAMPVLQQRAQWWWRFLR